jgi:aryl-alcohol dehydrogenase-like predicted oxidoreductase
MDFNEKTTLGRTGMKVGRLGISSSYRAPAAAFEEAFERGCNYFNMGSFIRGRSKEMIKAIRNIVAKGKRGELVVAMYDYTHSPLIGQGHFMKGLREKGLAKYLGVSSHQRKVFAEFSREGLIDIYHVRYNAGYRERIIQITTPAKASHMGTMK